MHIHSKLEIYINDEQIFIPNDVGIDDVCMRALHTHEEQGLIHAEYPVLYAFTLGNFFSNLEEVFNSNQILDSVVDDSHIIRMTVNGEESLEFENVVLTDGQVIAIYYEEI